jgi:S1-C subfamily serine protease
MPERRTRFLSCCLLALFGFVTLNSPAVRAEELKLLTQIQERHERIHALVAPAVVAVECKNGRKDSQSYYGTGVVVSPEGLVLTSSTVVSAAARSVQVFFSDGRVMDGRVVSTDDKTESCVLQVIQGQNDKKSLPYVELADSSKASVGELAYTAGNPFHTISRDGQVAWSIGTISGTYNINSADEQSRYQGQILETDAAVNPGSDGGPLIDANGRLLGILSLCFCESRWLGTAIPVHLIQKSLTPLNRIALVDPKEKAKTAENTNTTVVPVIFEEDDAMVGRAVPDALRTVARPAANSMVKLNVKRAGAARGENKGSLVRRLRQRPDGPVSGVIIEADGIILTSAFNVEGDVSGIDATLTDGRTFPATLLGRNLGLDIAVLKVQPKRGELLPALQLATEPGLQIGRYITIMGSSENGPMTHTSGIVSALARLDGCAVQTDALTNYGNSGGAVIDLRGRLVGIAAHVRTHADWSQQNSGVGFFTQSDKILASLGDLKAGRDIKAPPRPFLGVSPVDGATEIRGVKLEKVIPASAAANAKLEPGDVIVAVDGMDTHSWPALVRVLKAHVPGDSIEITFQRGTVTSRVQTVLTSKEGR